MENNDQKKENQQEIPKKETPKPAAKPKKDPRDKLLKLSHRPYILSTSPHASLTDSVPKIMWNVIGSLVPVVIMSVYYFGFRAVWMIAACVAAAMLTEALINVMKGESFTVNDGSAAITGLLLALILPPTFSIGGGILGSVFSIAIGKQIFGGLGFNIFNPALLGRAFLQASFPVDMTTWANPSTEKYVDAVSTATPLGLFKFEGKLTDYEDLLLGNIGGSFGETCAIALIAGGLYLVIRKYADWRIPLSFLSTVFVLGGIFWLINPQAYPDPIFHLFSGGLMIGAFYMATDMVTSPVTSRGAWIFGFGCGLFVIIIRLYGGLPEGVMYAILLMNSVTPLINRYTRPRIFGEVRA